jgi:hypothetical protein
MPNLVVIEYTQSIAYEQNGAPQERLSISVRFTYEAVSSGWVRENFRRETEQAKTPPPLTALQSAIDQSASAYVQAARSVLVITSFFRVGL